MILFLILCGIALIANNYFHFYRNKKVKDFCYKMIDEGLYDYLPNYNKMVYSFKPLTKENWIKKDKL